MSVARTLSSALVVSAVMALFSACGSHGGGGVTCSNFGCQGQAQAYFNTHPGSGLDEDGDGIACESLPPCLDSLSEEQGDPSIRAGNIYDNASLARLEWRETQRADGTLVREGPVVGWSSKGRLLVMGKYLDGKREGEWIFWNEDGSIDLHRSGTCLLYTSPSPRDS